MTTYNHSVLLITPIAMLETAKQISRALDPDVGGYEAFKTLASPTGNPPVTHAIYGTMCSAGFLEILQMPPEQIYSLVAADYARRWTEFTPPTIEAVTAFMSSLVYVADVHVDQALSDQNLKRLESSL